jgi:hypothetical protein
MKVYRGYNKEVGPISYTHWTYVTPDIEQAKWYATKDGFIKDGAIIEYDMDKDHMSWISFPNYHLTKYTYLTQTSSSSTMRLEHQVRHPLIYWSNISLRCNILVACISI